MGGGGGGSVSLAHLPSDTCIGIYLPLDFKSLNSKSTPV